MAKTLPILAVAGAALAALGVSMLSPESVALMAIFPVFAIVAAIFLVLERRPPEVIAGVVLVVGSLVGFLSITEVSFRTVDLDFHSSLGGPFVVGLGLLVTAVITYLRREEARPAWIMPASLAAAAVAYVWFYLVEDALFGSPVKPAATLLPALVALLAMGAAVQMLRDPVVH